MRYLGQGPLLNGIRDLGFDCGYDINWELVLILTLGGSEKETGQSMEEAVAELERIQNQILQRISVLELSYLQNPESAPTPSSFDQTNSDADTEARLSAILRANGVKHFSFKRVPSDYYDWPLEARRDALGAASVHHLCKSIVLVHFLSSILCSVYLNSFLFISHLHLHFNEV